MWGNREDFLAGCKEELTLRPDDLGRTYVKEVGGRTVGLYTLEGIDTERVELGHLFVETRASDSIEGRLLPVFEVSLT